MRADRRRSGNHRRGSPVGSLFVSDSLLCRTIPRKTTRSCSRTGLYVTTESGRRGEIGEQYRQRRLDLTRSGRPLLRSRSGLQDRPHLRVVLRELSVMPARLRAHVASRRRLRLESPEAAHVIDQRTGLIADAVEVTCQL